MQSAIQAGGIIPRCPDDKSGSSVPTVLSSPQGELKTVGAIEGLCHLGSTPFGDFSFGSFSGCFSSNFTSSRYLSVTVQCQALGRNIHCFLDLVGFVFWEWKALVLSTSGGPDGFAADEFDAADCSRSEEGQAAHRQSLTPNSLEGEYQLGSGPGPGLREVRTLGHTFFESPQNISAYSPDPISTDPVLTVLSSPPGGLFLAHQANTHVLGRQVGALERVPEWVIRGALMDCLGA